MKLKSCYLCKVCFYATNLKLSDTLRTVGQLTSENTQRFVSVHISVNVFFQIEPGKCVFVLSYRCFCGASTQCSMCCSYAALRTWLGESFCARVDRAPLLRFCSSLPAVLRPLRRSPGFARAVPTLLCGRCLVAVALFPIFLCRPLTGD